MRMKLLIALLMISALATWHTLPIDANPSYQISPLPADLLFTTTNITGDGDFPRNLIARVNAETLEVTPFYIDDEAFEISPISWSPRGDLLAIYRRLPPLDEAYTLFPRQICILDRNGVFQRCLDDAPPMQYGGRPQSWQHYYPVAWSPDGQTIFFDTEYSNENSQFGYGRRLVEASVLTGQTLRIVYEYQDPYNISPSPDFAHAAVGFGGPWAGFSAPVYLVNLITGVQVDISSVVPDLTTLTWTCLPFSPKGSYVAVHSDYELATYAPGQDPTLNYGTGSLLVILDLQGSIIDTIGEPNGESTLWTQSCPGWQPDEQAMFFLVQMG